jgi:hypothetical protein
MLRREMTIILSIDEFVADALDDSEVRAQREQLAMVTSASIRERHTARRFPSWEQPNRGLASMESVPIPARIGGKCRNQKSPRQIQLL